MGVGGHKRLLVMLGLVFCLCGFARPALAAPKVGKVVNGSGDAATVDVQVIGSGISNGFSAAAWSFGVDPASLTAEQKANLSNESTGGAFYRYAMAFQSGAHEPLTVGLSSWYAVTLPQFVWTLEGYPYGDYAQARRDLKTIRDGGSLGGGGGSISDVYTFTGGTYFRATTPKHAFLSGGLLRYYVASRTEIQNGTVAMASTDLVVNVPKSCAPNFFAEYGTGSYDLVLQINCSGSGSFQSFQIMAFPMGHIVWQTAANTVYTTTPYYSRFDLGETLTGRTISLSVGTRYDYSGNTINISSSVVDNGTGSGYGVAAGVPNAGAILLSGGVHAGPTLPPNNNWPDDPVTDPDPPDVPEPSDDPVIAPEPPDLPNPVEYPVSDPYTPDPDPPTNPVITYDPDPTGDALDYRPWLNAILKLLRTINTSINDGFYNMDVWLTEHCDHIREMMHKEALSLGLKMQAAINNGFVSFERWLQGTYGPYFFEKLDATLRSILADYEDYLYDLFVWLSDQFDFSVSGGAGSYDDSTLLYWLQQIWAILAEKPSVGTEPDSFFDWLANLLAGILGGLVVWLLGALGGMADAVSGLATKFPFSLPWDIATMLALFVHEPVTPVFDLPFALPGEYANVRVDMSYFDEVMAAVRGVELVLFGLALAKRTPDMLELADTVFS